MAKSKKVNYVEAERILREARETLEKHGWAKGTARKGAAYCADAAIDAINGKVLTDDRTEAKRLVLNLTGTTNNPEYNDRPATTKDDVLTILRAAEQMAHDYSLEAP